MNHSIHLTVILLGLLQANAALSAPEPISPLWHYPKTIHHIKSITLSPDGSTAGIIGNNGKIQVFTREGKMIWQQTIPEVNTLVLGNHAQAAIAYPRLDPYEYTVYFLNGIGEIIRHQWLRSPIWSAALDNSCKTALVGISSKQLYRYTLTKKWASYKHWSVPGIPSNVACSPDGRYLAAGTWNESGLITYRPNGTFLWQYLHENPNQFFDSEISPSGKTLMAILQPNPGDQTGRIMLWGASGKQELNLNLHAYRIRAALSLNEKIIAATYTRQVKLSQKRVPEQKVALYNSRGRKIWDKGGLFLCPTLISVAPDGRWVLCHDGDKSLYLLGNQGKILAKTEMPFRIRATAASINGRTILISGINDQAQLLTINR